MSTKSRLAVTAVCLFVYGWLSYLMNYGATLAIGKIAGMQFEPSDSAYVVSGLGMYSLAKFGVIAPVILLAALALVWWKPMKKFWTTSAIILLIAASTAVSCQAYYDKENWNEPYFILPNESAFWIPDVGDNKSGQSKFGTEQYLRDNKIAAKRFSVPHMKLENSGFWSNYYVPSGRLIIVDRTPYNKEWVSSSTRGTSAKNEGFPVQSKEGINVTVGISIAASVTEEDSPRFLYRFGVNPPRGDRTKPEVIFTSVYYGKSLAEIMDGVVRNKVQTLLGNEFTKRNFEECNVQAEAIMNNVCKELAAWMASIGITLDFLGWADTFEFDKEIQSSINRRFIAVQDEVIAQRLGPHTKTIQALATAEALRSFGAKTDGKLPNTVSLWWLPSGLSDFFTGLSKPIPNNTSQK